MKTLTELIKEHNEIDYITEQLRDHLYKTNSYYLTEIFKPIWRRI